MKINPFPHFPLNSHIFNKNGLIAVVSMSQRGPHITDYMIFWPTLVF